MLRRRVFWELLALFLGVGGQAAYGQFTIGQDLPGLCRSEAKWADIDQDRDLDLAVCGRNKASTAAFTLIYKNTGGLLSEHQVLEGVYSEGSDALAWGDYNGDGAIDLAVAGQTIGGVRITRIYKNNGQGDFTHDVDQNLIPVKNASLSWGDYDNDGDLDLHLQGDSNVFTVGVLYENNPLGMLSIAYSMPPLRTGSSDWGDFDNDGDLDLLVTGSPPPAGVTLLMQNHPPGSLLVGTSAGFLGLYLSDVATGDFDADGDLDVAISGELDWGGPRFAKIYVNDGTGFFYEFYDCARPLYRSSCAWGDYDSDGDLDLILCGYDGTSFQTRFYRNDVTTFSEVSFGVQALAEGALNWADIDGDGDLDFIMTGEDFTKAYTRTYINGGTANTAPLLPTLFTAGWGGDTLGVVWMGATDAETGSDGLTYCLRIGSSSGADDIFSGTYGSPLMGNIGPCRTLGHLRLIVPQVETFYSIRTIDAGLMPSSWATEQVLASSCDCSFHCDVTGDQILTPLDVATIVMYVYRSRDARWPNASCIGDNGDWDCNGVISPVDVAWYVNYVYRQQGNGPCDPCLCAPYATKCPAYP